MTTRTALILKGTGKTRGHLEGLLPSPHLGRVCEYGRRIKSVKARNNVDFIEWRGGHRSIKQKEIGLDKLEQNGSLRAGCQDVVSITLKTTKANARSAEAFARIAR
ncbi:hypothetical protein PM082_022943 [Marasmius tenuissimus]|nr:hypothetical protein PM082_022943 [Marasmius tenuissimus]